MSRTRFPRKNHLLGIALAVLHILLLLTIARSWSQAYAEYGDPYAGPTGQGAFETLKQVDFPLSYLCRWATHRILLLNANRLHMPLGLADAAVYWPLLFVLGTCQWFLVGYVVQHICARLIPWTNLHKQT